MGIFKRKSKLFLQLLRVEPKDLKNLEKRTRIVEDSQLEKGRKIGKNGVLKFPFYTVSFVSFSLDMRQSVITIERVLTNLAQLVRNSTVGMG